MITEDENMRSLNRKENGQFSIQEAAQTRVTEYLHDVFSREGGLLGDLDKWSQRCITEENMAKLALVFESDDPAEACYGDLIREIDAEAESGIYLARPHSSARHLHSVVDEAGVSGELHRDITTVAPIMFGDEAAHSTEDLDLVWVTIEARHDRAHLDAMVSEIIMSHLLDDADAARDMSEGIRALLYSFHEDEARSRCELPRLLDERNMHDVLTMVTELIKRSGNPEKRRSEIRGRIRIN
jgi:hypothetical protein